MATSQIIGQSAEAQPDSSGEAGKMTPVEMSQPARQEPTDLERTFEELTRQWREETAHFSSQTHMAMHPAYQRIIGLGPAVLPLIFRELEYRPDFWFWALRAITGENPVCPEDAGKVRRMTKAWLDFAHERGYL